MAEGQSLELIPLSELRGAGILAQDDILVTYAMHSFPVQGRLVRSHHARKEGLRVVLISYRLRSFMDTEIVSYAMSRSMSEISHLLP